MRRSGRIVGVAVCGALAACSAPFLSEVSPDDGAWDGRAFRVPEIPSLVITHIDVGQGDATLVEGPTGRLLIDGGYEGMGERVLDLLQDRRLAYLDWVVATHPHADHVGGLDDVLDEVEVLHGVWDNGTTYASQSFYQYRAAAEESAGGRRTLEPGQEFDLGGGARAVCVAVNGELIDGTTTAASEPNDLSAAFVIEWGAFRYFLGGDLGGKNTATIADIETALAPLVGDVDVLRVNHHGSRFSTNAAWLNALRPEAAVISLGDDNDYGHPAAETLARLSAADPAVQIPPVDVWLTEKGAAQSPYVGSGDVVVTARSDRYTIGYQDYTAVGQ